MATRSHKVRIPTHIPSVPCTALTQLDAVANGRARRCQPPLCRQARGARACGSWARARLPGEGLQQRARDVRRARRPGQAQDGAARVRAPVRRQQPAERRHDEPACAPRSGIAMHARPTRQACGLRARASSCMALLCRRARRQAPARGGVHAAGTRRHAGALRQDLSPGAARVADLHQWPCPGNLGRWLVQAAVRQCRAGTGRLARQTCRQAHQACSYTHGGLGEGRARGPRAPAVPSTLRASGSSSSTPSMRPRPSRSHDTAAPAVAIAPCARARALARPCAAVPVTGPQARARCAAAGAPVSLEPAAGTRRPVRERARPLRERSRSRRTAHARSPAEPRAPGMQGPCSLAHAPPSSAAAAAPARASCRSPSLPLGLGQGMPHLQRKLRLCLRAQAVRDGGQQPARGRDAPRPRVQQHEAAGAIRALRGARAAALAQHRRLLVAQAACRPRGRQLGLSSG